MPGLTPNYFTSNRLLSGYSSLTGATYRAAAQFDTTAATVPAQATVTGASIHLWGQAWVYNDTPGTWRVNVLNASADAGFATANYAAIAGAAVDFQVPPTLGTGDLYAGDWTSLSIPATEYAAVKGRLATGALSTRIDGPTGPLGALFDWATGYPLPCSSLSPANPELSATYSLSGDTSGPVVTALRADPNPTWGAGTNLSATASDATTGGTPIAAVEFFVDADPGVGRAGPMGAADGAFDAVTEGAVRVLDAAPLPPGTHNVSVRAEDRAGNWGPVSTFVLYVRARDPVGPVVVAVSADPPVAELSLNTTLRATVTDDLGVAGVDFDVRDASGSSIGNFSATLNRTSGRWERSRAYPEGSFTFTAWGRDTGGNLASRSGSFEVRGGGPVADAGPDARIDLGHGVNLDGTNSTDDIAIVRWQWTVTGPGGTWTFNTSVVPFTPAAAGTYIATLRVWDAAGRTATDSANVTVVGPEVTVPASWTWPLILAVVLLVAIAATAVAVAWRRRKREGPPPTPPA